MAKKNLSAKDLQAKIDALNAISDRNIELMKEEMNSLDRIMDARDRIARKEEIANAEREKHLNTQRLIGELEAEGYKIHGTKLKNVKSERLESEKIHKSLVKRLNLQKNILNTIAESIKISQNGFSKVASYLMESDAAMKGLSLELGLSGERAAMLSNSLEDAAVFSAGLGVDMKGLAQMASVYAEETGRARMHNEANLKAMTSIAKGTALGIEGAAQLASQYEMMGFNATDTAKEVQRIVDTTERMGVNTGKVLKAVNKNFKTLQKYTFRGGSQGMADMAMYATKFKVNMEEVLSAMEKGRSLDSVIEMSAQLQVLGGQFANLADPMSMLFESRNDPEAYTKRINEMTKGMVTMNKTAKGFELQIASPMAQDQLAQAAKALGMTTDELTTQAFRMREIQQTRKQMFGSGLSGEEKEIVEGLAKFNKDTGRMMVEIGGVSTDVSKLTSDQVKALKQEQATLDERAKASQSFDQAFQNTIMQLKATMLPLLKTINGALEAVRPTVDKMINFFDQSNGFVKGGLMVAAALTLAAGKIGMALAKEKLMGALLGSGGAAKGAASAASGAGGMSGAQMLGKGKGAMAAGKGAGLSALGKGAGVGVAAVGIGTGVMLAAKGISQLADSMSKLSVEQLESFERVALGLAIAIPAMAAGMVLLGTAASASAVGIGILTLAVLGIGAGIGIAAAGVGYMAEGMAKLDEVDLTAAGAGMMQIGAAALMMANPLSILGLGAMTASVTAIGANAANMERVGNAFGQIGAVLQGSASQFKEVRDTIQAIASTEVGGNSAISQLTEMLSKPLRVEFPEGEVGIVANIDVSMGGDNFITQVSKKIPARIVDLQQAKA